MHDQILQQANALNGLSQSLTDSAEYGTVRTFSGDLISEASGTLTSSVCAQQGRQDCFLRFCIFTACFAGGFWFTLRYRHNHPLIIAYVLPDVCASGTSLT